jgi:hypothetical protein
MCKKQKLLSSERIIFNEEISEKCEAVLGRVMKKFHWSVQECVESEERIFCPSYSRGETYTCTENTHTNTQFLCVCFLCVLYFRNK